MFKIIEIFSVAVILLALAFVTTALPTMTEPAEARARIRSGSGTSHVKPADSASPAVSAKPGIVGGTVAAPVRVINDEAAAERTAAQQERANRRLIETGEMKPPVASMSVVTEPTPRASKGIVCLAGC